MNAKLDLNKITHQLQQYLLFSQKYIKFIYFIFAAAICGFILYQIQVDAQVEPSDEAVSEQLKAVQRPHIDKDALGKIQQLQDQNIEVQSLFDQARNNPFDE